MRKFNAAVLNDAVINETSFSRRDELSRKVRQFLYPIHAGACSKMRG